VSWEQGRDGREEGGREGGGEDERIVQRVGRFLQAPVEIERRGVSSRRLRDYGYIHAYLRQSREERAESNLGGVVCKGRKGRER